MRPLVAFVTFYRDGMKVFETDIQGVSEGWDKTSKAVPIRFTIPLAGLSPGSYDCQVTVLDPSGGRAAFWRAAIAVAAPPPKLQSAYSSGTTPISRNHGLHQKRLGNGEFASKVVNS